MLPPLILYHDFILFLIFIFILLFYYYYYHFFNHDFIALASQPPLITPTPALDISLSSGKQTALESFITTNP